MSMQLPKTSVAHYPLQSGQHGAVARTRQRLGFRESLRIAMDTVSVSAGGAFPLVHALYWWVRGVPDNKVKQAEGPSRLDLMSPRERRIYVWTTGVCAISLFVGLVIYGFLNH